MEEFVHVKVKRQDSPDDLPYWEEFRVAYQPSMNVVMLLQMIQAKPMNADGVSTAPIACEYSCLEEVCGACTMVINGRVRQACSALIDNLEQPITLEPMRKFAVVRDLKVDRSPLFDALKKVNAWVKLDGFHDQGPGPVTASEDQQHAYQFARCMMCGCCCDACPQYNERTDFVGPHAISQVNLLNQHSIGKQSKGERLDSLMEDGGIADCGNAQNCAQVCPKEIPLTEAIATVGWDATKRAVKKFLKG